MMAPAIPIWKNIPFLRFLLPLIAGIIAAWYFQLSLFFALSVFGCSLLCLALHQFFKNKRNSSWLFGAGISLLFVSVAIALVQIKQPSFKENWFGHHYRAVNTVAIRLLEPLSEKEKSYKALAEFISIKDSTASKPVSGKLMLYFRKDSTAPALQYGSVIITNKLIPFIQNAGNPGGFDYERYAMFNGITHQLFLNRRDYLIAAQLKQNGFQKWLYDAKAFILDVLRKNIRGEEETSVAEALLIGYRDDLDRDLVQAYSNTGVVHVIAISGLHLGLIYWLLLLLLKPLDKRKQLRWMKPVIAVALLWIFSLLTGAGASVVRAAFMFPIIAYYAAVESIFIMGCWISAFLRCSAEYCFVYEAYLSLAEPNQ
jgi:competence protein ComEC